MKHDGCQPTEDTSSSPAHRRPCLAAMSWSCVWRRRACCGDVILQGASSTPVAPDCRRPMKCRPRWWRARAPRAVGQWWDPLVVGPVALDVPGRRVMIAGYIVHLPAREAAILDVLMRNAGKVVSISELCTVIGQRQDHGRYVARLARRMARRLIVSPLRTPLVESVGNVGYRYTPIGSPQGRHPGSVS